MKLIENTMHLTYIEGNALEDTLMKKFVVISLLIDLIIVIIAVSVFIFNSSDSVEQQIVDVCKIIIQATITGTITFTGLLLTFLSQEQQIKNKNKLELCPCFIIENCNSLSAIKTKDDIAKNSGVLICSTAANIRTVECAIVNCKDTYGLNVSLETCDGAYKLGNLKSQDIELILAVNGKEETSKTSLNRL